MLRASIIQWVNSNIFPILLSSNSHRTMSLVVLLSFSWTFLQIPFYHGIHAIPAITKYRSPERKFNFNPRNDRYLYFILEGTRGKFLSLVRENTEGNMVVIWRRRGSSKSPRETDMEAGSFAAGHRQQIACAKGRKSRPGIPWGVYEFRVKNLTT